MPSTGSCITSTKDFAENHNIAAENRDEADRDDRHLVCRGRQVQRAADRLAAARCALPTHGRRSHVARTTLHLLSGHADGADQRRPQCVEPAPQYHRRCRDPQRGAEGALLSAGDVQGGFAFYMQDGKLHYVYNYVGSEFLSLESTISVPEGRHQLCLEFEVTGAPDIKQRQGRAGQRSALHRWGAGRARRMFL